MKLKSVLIVHSFETANPSIFADFFLDLVHLLQDDNIFIVNTVVSKLKFFYHSKDIHQICDLLLDVALYFERSVNG